MRFTSDNSNHNSRELTDAVSEEHPAHIAALAEESIKAMHSHKDGSEVEIHEIGSREFIRQSIQGSIEGKLGGSFGSNSDSEKNPLQLQNATKIEYEKKSSQQPQQLYGTQQSMTGGASHHQDTVLMGCNCGAEWTVTGQSTKEGDGLKIEQYGSQGGSAGYNVSGAGGEMIKYAASGPQQKEYKG
ncbi:hypothetical protein HYU18_04345 [Candidatus Woesearchaeota archaeon]|nr:hypothetical protein [Candidatus Woesearchaeota archaeon]